MSTQKIIFAFLSGILLAACSTKQSLPVPKISGDFLTKNSADLSGAVFFIGPDIDSVNAAIVAECDCCASDMAFLNDSAFIYVERCMGGDVYVKGNYTIWGNILIITTDEEVVSSEDDYSSEIEVPVKYEITQGKRAWHAYTISTLKGKQVIKYSKDDYTEYGMRDQISISSFLQEFRSEKTLRAFLNGKD